jgi:hypothetical protein
MAEQKTARRPSKSFFKKSKMAEQKTARRPKKKERWSSFTGFELTRIYLHTNGTALGSAWLCIRPAQLHISHNLR